jgi:protein involved in polysaccharide export with SLBB domain
MKQQRVISAWPAWEALLLLLLLLSCWVAAAQTRSTGVDKGENAIRPPYSDPAQSDATSDADEQRRLGMPAYLTRRPVLSDEAAGSLDAALPADRLVDILSRHPELQASFKRMVVNQLRQQGESISVDTVTPEELYKRLQEDRKLRAVFTQLLAAEGYLNDENGAQLSAEGQSETDSYEADGLDTGLDPSDDRATDIPRLMRKRGSGSKAESRLNSGGDDGRSQVSPEPVAVRLPSPYPGLPSLRDLYAQVPPQDGPVRRFGGDVFRIRQPGRSTSMALDIPAGTDYVLGPGDQITIVLWGGVSQRFTRTVDREGRVALPDVGVVELAGKTIAEAQLLLQGLLTPYYRNVRADISLSRMRTVRVYVVGDVARPGAYDVSSLSTPLTALYAAGGPTARGSMRQVKHFRGSRLVRETDLYEFLLHGVRPDTERLEAGDTILVPPVGAQVTVAGMVRRPAIYELRNEKGLADVVDLAGGLLVTAALSQIKVERVQAHEQRAMLSVDLPNGSTLEDLRKLLGPLGVQDGDRITISPIAPNTSQVVYLQGHVTRPGRYPFRDGMDVGQLLKSYADVLPEPAEHAEIIRLQPPDYRPRVIDFDLREVLDKTDPLELQPLDTVRIYGRYEADAPKASIYGEVLRPGEYPLSEGMTAADLVRMAGGFKRSAFTATADVSSYAVQNGQKVKIRHATVEIAKALAGDHKADAVLKPGDVVSIRQLTGWNDIGASVVINGEVRYPGTYGIEEGERLSSVLKRAGGFRDSAYPAGAMLERNEVREFAEKSRMEMIRRIEAASPSVLKLVAGLPGQEQPGAAQMMMQQQQQVLASLRQRPATGRLVIKITSDLHQWENTPADIELRAGDVLTIPKQPNFVLVNGQVYSPSAITYAPGKRASWYLQQAGGPTELANRKTIFIIRANGSVVGSERGYGLWKQSVLSTRLHPGDTLVIPEKIVGGSPIWKNLLSTAQLASSLAVAARIATSF